MKKRTLAILLVLAMVLGMFPAAAGAEGNIIIRFYVSGTGSTQDYSVADQPMGDGTTDSLKVESNFALLESATITDSSALPDQPKIEGNEAVRTWLEENTDIPEELADIEAVVTAVNAVYQANDINTMLETNYFTGFEFESAEWIGSNDGSYHVHVKLIRQECTVTFDQNYDGAPTTQERVGRGMAVSEPTAPTREGYTFKGWYKDKDGTQEQEYDFSTQVTESFTLYAKWEKDLPDVTVEKALTKVVRDDKELSAEELTASDFAVYAGDVLTWTITVTNNMEKAHSFAVSDTLTLTKQLDENYADIEEKPLTVTDGSDSFNKDSVTIQPGDSKKLTATYTVEGLYEGYTMTNTATVTYDNTTYPASTKHPVGYTITVTYNGNGGTTAEGNTTVVETFRQKTTPVTVTVPNDAHGFSYEGHTFNGWYTEPSGGTAVTGTQPEISSSATYFAQWKEAGGGSGTTGPEEPGGEDQNDPRGTLKITRLPCDSTEPVTVVIRLGYGAQGTYEDVVFQNGTAVVRLLPGQSVYASGLRADTNYTVTAEDVIYSSGMTGMIIENQTVEAKFLAVPQTIIIDPGEEEAPEIEEGTEETAPEEGEVPEEDWEELPEEGEAPAEEEPVDVPKTGDVAPSIGLAFLFGLAACAAVLKKARAK